jgi:hypothetical protein
VAQSSILDFGQLSAEELLVYKVALQQGITQAFLNAPIVNYQKISYTQNIGGQLAGLPGQVGRVVPEEVLFPIAPPTMRLQEYVEDATYNPLIRETIRMRVKYFQGGYKARRADFFRDVQNTIRNVSQALMRPVAKLGDVETARILRDGKVLTDYTNTPFFSTAKPISPSGAIGGTYSNLSTNAPLTAANVSAGIQRMMSYVGEDGLSLNIRPDTLIVPPTLYPAAQQAVNLANNVFSTNGNPFPGQAANTASFADNWIFASGIIKQVIEMPELLDGGAGIDTTTWYLAECQNPSRGGAWGLLVGDDPTVDVAIAMAPTDWSVASRDEFTWSVKKFFGVAPGLPFLMNRFEA